MWWKWTTMSPTSSARSRSNTLHQQARMVGRERIERHLGLAELGRGQDADDGPRRQPPHKAVDGGDRDDRAFQDAVSLGERAPGQDGHASSRGLHQAPQDVGSFVVGDHIVGPGGQFGKGAVEVQEQGAAIPVEARGRAGRDLQDRSSRK